MKINNVILSVNDNVSYQYFWPIVSKLWAAMGINPVLYWVTQTPVNTEFPYPSEIGTIHRVAPLRNDDHFSCLLVRIVGLATTPGINIISDIDLFPVSTKFFVDSLLSVEESTLVHLSTELKYTAEYGKFPMAFYVGHNAVFTRLLQITQATPVPIAWNDAFIDDVYFITESLEGYSKLNDEAYMFKKFITYGLKGHSVKIFPRWALRAWNIDYLRKGDFSNIQYYVDTHFSPWRLTEIKVKENVDLFPRITELGECIYRHILSPREYSGARCSFQVDPLTNTGVKKYMSKESCDFAYHAQQKAYKVQAAPKPLERIDEVSFRTEIADTKTVAARLSENTYYNDMFPELHKKLAPIFRTSPFVTAGPEGVDLSTHNLGLYQGHIVMIDFS